MKKNLLILAMALCATGAWAGEKTVVKYSFDDATSPTLTAGSNATLDYTRTSVVTETAFLNIWGANNTNGATTIALTENDLSGETWTLSFYWAGYTGCNKKAGSTILKAGDTELFKIADAANWGSTMTFTPGDVAITVAACSKSTRISAKVADDYNKTNLWYLITVKGSADGVKLTMAPCDGSDAVITDAELSATNVTPTAITMAPGSAGGLGIDELLLTYYVEGEVIQNPIAKYTKVDGIKRVITATCDTEGATIKNSLDGETWTDGAEVTVSESCNVYFKAVKGTSESDIVTFAAEAGVEIALNTPVINRTSNTSVTITADQTNLLLSPDATIYYTYGDETGSFTGSKTLTVEADAAITAYAEYEGYTTSEKAERAVALFPEYVYTIESTAAKTSGWTTKAFSDETVTASERTYAALMLDDVQWGTNILFQKDGAWGFRTNGSWYVDTNTNEAWLLVQNVKAGDIVVIDATYAPSATVNATFSKYAYGSKHAFIIGEDGQAEFGLKKIAATVMDYFMGVYIYTPLTAEEIAAYEDAKKALEEVIADAKDIDVVESITLDDNENEVIVYKEKGEELLAAITAAEKALADAAKNFDTESLKTAKENLEAAIKDFYTATGIQTVNAAETENGAIYNLAGQRVMNAQKGLFIMNGKKYIVK